LFDVKAHTGQEKIRGQNLSTWNRRTFVQVSAAAMLTMASRKLLGNTQAPRISNHDGLISVKGPSYVWEYAIADDTFRFLDSRNRLIVSGRLQPAVVVAPSENPLLRQCTQGRASEHRIDPDRVTIVYEGVNGAARLSVSWRFDEQGIWTEPVIYETRATEDVVSLHYFSDAGGKDIKPLLHSSYLVVPGISEGSSISPIVRDSVHLDQSVWLGRGSFLPGLTQQWGLPLHYFSGFSVDASSGQRDMFTTGRSDAFVCGLGDLPAGDLFLQLHEGSCSTWIDYRSDLWKHMRGPARLSLGATFLWSVAPDYRGAIARYYEALIRSGTISKHHNSAHKTATALTPQFCTWGAQVDRNKTGEHLDQAFLTEIYRELKASGMKAGLFSIDDKWEESYGSLVHAKSRLPHFEQFLDQLRADGYRIGLWAALMRCEQPSDLGLTLDNMLQGPDGKPYLANDFGGSRYYILDFTQPVVEQTLTRLVRQFIRRYKPDLFKFDFGYELPSVGIAAPKDRKWTGERLMQKGLDVVLKAMREENPDLVVMYYQLSPLFIDYFDLHSTDDLFLASGEYDLEANRRLYFSSLLGPLGIPTYGSSGYDWASAPNIWFDSAAVGTIGSLNDFRADEDGEGCTPELVARYNGLTKVLRQTNTFEVLPLGSVSQAPTFGAHARSWARLEDEVLVLLAFRPPIPGEENPLAAQTTDPRIKDVVRSVAPVVIASRDDQGIARSGQLAIVSYGSGEIAIRREQGKRAEILSHYFGGGVIPQKKSIDDGFLRIIAEERDSAGKPLEWIEVRVS
jgi:hypothetical protein